MVKLRGAYYFGYQGKCNFFVAEGISRGPDRDQAPA